MLKINAFYKVVRLSDIKSWLLQINISGSANKFDLSDLYMLSVTNKELRIIFVQFG